MMSKLPSTGTPSKEAANMEAANNESTNMDTATVSWFKKMMGWLKQIMLFLAFSIVVTGLFDIWRGKDIERDNLPDMKAISLNDEMVDVLAMSQDQTVLVYFWASWCPVCNFVSPAVDTLSAYYPTVSVVMNSGTDEKMKQYLQHKDYSFDTINDNEGLLAQDWSIRVTPTIMVFKEGELQYYTTGFTSLPGIWWRLLLA